MMPKTAIARYVSPLFFPAALALLAVAAAFLTPCGARGDEEKAKELLRGVEKKLNAVDSFSVKFEYIDRMVQEPGMQRCLITADFDHGKMLFHLDWPEGNVKMSCLYRDGEVMTYKEGQKDVKVMDVQKARGTFYTPIYDPRIIGLTDVKHVGDSISLALYLQRPGHFEAEKIEDGPDGQSRYRIVYTEESEFFKGEISNSYLVQEPSFRVESRIFKTIAGDAEPNLYTEIQNQYDDKISKVLPSVSTILRTQHGDLIFDSTTNLLEFAEKKFPDDYFSPKSMDLEMNSTFTDYRIHKITGYWNGHEIVDHWTDPNAAADTITEDAAAESPPSRYLWFRVVCGIGSVLILLILFARMGRLKNG
ncbi:MAG: hypothetical protein IKE64_14225 [Thermoguttaceae bacterium]|nr:hypothetical protein [Thermoguttaceae bacterium]